MRNDLNIACKSLNLTLDEVIILLHLICNGFMGKNTTFSSINFDTKQNRQQWEDLFNRSYLVPITESIAGSLTEANMVIKEQMMKASCDEENQSKIYFMAYELLNPDESKSFLLYENEQFWKYRPNVSFDLMAVEFSKLNVNKLKHGTLSKFLEINHQLQLMINLSPIVCLVKLFISVLNKSIFKNKARNMSIGEFVDSDDLPRGFFTFVIFLVYRN